MAYSNSNIGLIVVFAHFLCYFIENVWKYWRLPLDKWRKCEMFCLALLYSNHCVVTHPNVTGVDVCGAQCPWLSIGFGSDRYRYENIPLHFNCEIKKSKKQSKPHQLRSLSSGLGIRETFFELLNTLHQLRKANIFIRSQNRNIFHQWQSWTDPRLLHKSLDNKPGPWLRVWSLGMSVKLMETYFPSDGV